MIRIAVQLLDTHTGRFERLKRGTVEADAEARVYFERALETDPSYARAYTGLSLSHFNEWSCQAWHKWDETERLAYDYARRAQRIHWSKTVLLGHDASSGQSRMLALSFSPRCVPTTKV